MSFKLGQLNDGSTYKYKDYQLCDNNGNGYRCGDDNILTGLSKSKHVVVNDKPVSERKLNNIFADLLNSRIHLDLEKAAPAIEKVLSKVETLGDGFTVNFLVKEAEFPEPPDLIPKIAFSVPTMIPYETDVKVSLAPARQIYEVYKKENYEKRKQSKDLVAAVHGKPWSLVTPDEYVVEQYNPLSMQKLMLSGNETQFGSDRKMLLTDYIVQSGATVVITFTASETITCMTGHVDDILLVSLLDSPAADSYERNYSRIFARKTSNNPKKRVIPVRLNLRIRDISSMCAMDFLNLCEYEIDGTMKLFDLDGRKAVFVHNFSPDLVKLAAQFPFSIGYYISVEHAMILPTHVFPPQLPDAELDRMNLTYAMIERDPLVLTRSHTSIFDPSRNCVISFSEHAAYPDPVFEDRGCNLPLGVIAVDMQVCSAKVKSKTRVKVLLGVQSDDREFKLIPPNYDGSLLLRRDTRIKFVPSVEFLEMEFLSGTLVYPNQDVVYPVSGVYIYTIVNGVKLFADIKYSKMKYLERRLMLQRARMLLVPISSDPLWAYSIILDTGQKKTIMGFWCD